MPRRNLSDSSSNKVGLEGHVPRATSPPQAGGASGASGAAGVIAGTGARADHAEFSGLVGRVAERVDEFESRAAHNREGSWLTAMEPGGVGASEPKKRDEG